MLNVAALASVFSLAGNADAKEVEVPPAVAAEAEPPPVRAPDAPAEASTPSSAAGEAAVPKPDPGAKERANLGFGTVPLQCCAGVLVAWLPIPIVTSAASAYAVTAVGNATSARDGAAFVPIAAAVVSDLAVVGLIGAGYGIVYLAASSGSEALALGGLAGGLLLLTGAFFARPFVVGSVTTIAWQLTAEDRGAEPWLPPPLFPPDDT